MDQITLVKNALAKGFPGQKAPMSQEEAKAVINGLFAFIGETLVSTSDEITVGGFGKFFTQVKPAGKQRIPRTGEIIEVGPRKVARFHFSSVLQKAVRSGKLPA